jgi:DNA-binding NarL/FixJ family response regulator
LARELRVCRPHARIITLLDSSERSVVVEAFRSGASGILSREQPFEIMCKCIHAVYQGQVWASSKEMRYALDALSQNDMVPATKSNKSRTVLTQREEGLVRLVSEGLTNRDISQQLKLSENTVRNYLFRIFNKVGASNRLELALYKLNRNANYRHEPPGPVDSVNSIDKDLYSHTVDKT